MKIADVEAYATSFPVPPAARVALGIGQAFSRVIEDRVITILRPDLSKTGGITEGLRGSFPFIPTRR